MDSLAFVLLAGLAFGPVLLYLGNYNSDWWRRIALLGVILIIARYLHWRLGNTVPWGETYGMAIYMQTVAVIELLWVTEIVHAFSFFWSSGARTPGPRRFGALPERLREASVAVFIPTFNEGPEILERTILASRRLDWDGEVTVYVLDDGRRPWLGEMCARLGARWITRADNKGAKAGNINHALDKTDGEFILMLDADFLAHPDAIRRLMPVMAESRVAIAQAPHHFYNEDPVMRSLGTGRHLGDDQSLFFDRILPARDRGGFSFFCGTCALIRRVALVESGGLPSGSVTEDILLSVHLRQRGWETRCIEQRVATGLAPETLQALFVQRCRWARGAIQLLYLRTGLLARGLGLRQRLAYLPLYWIISPLVRIASLVIPQLYLLYAWLPLQNAPITELLKYQGPVIVAMGGMAAFVFRARWSPLVNGIWADVVAIRIAPSVLRDLVLPFRDMTFHVTPKGRKGKSVGSEEWMGAVVAAGIVFTLLALIMGPYGRWDDPYVSVSIFWAALNLVRLLGVFAVLWNSVPQAGDPSIEVRLRPADGFVLLEGKAARPLANWTLGETRLRAPAPQPIPVGHLARLGPNGRPSVLATVLPDGRLRYANTGARARLLSMLVALRVDAETPYRPAGAIRRAAARMFGFQTLARQT